MTDNASAKAAAGSAQLGRKITQSESRIDFSIESSKKKGQPSHEPAFLITTNDRLRAGDFQPRLITVLSPATIPPNVPRTLDRARVDWQIAFGVDFEGGNRTLCLNASLRIA